MPTNPLDRNKTLTSPIPDKLPILFVTVRADQLEIGDILVTTDGTYNDTIVDKFNDFDDSEKTWIETDNGDMGYVRSNQVFYVDPSCYQSL